MAPIDDPEASDPTTIAEAQKSIYWPQWCAAIHEELGALNAKGVYEDINRLPEYRKAVDSKWVLHIKRNAEGQIARFKARLVAKGFTQIPGQDFTHTFAPVARWDSIRLILALSAYEDRELRHIDIKTAFLNGPLPEEIYMRKPDVLGPGFWRLRKGLYGLRQAGRTWYIELNKALESLGFTRCESDWSVHHRGTPSDGSMTATSVDDILLSCTSVRESDDVTTKLKRLFELTDGGDVTWLLGCKIIRNRSRRSLTISQDTYIDSILREFHMDTSNAVGTPLPPKLQLTSDQCAQTEAEILEMKKIPYCTVVGKVMYLATTTRPDIAYAVRELARFMSNYGATHWAAAKHLLRYLQGTRSLGLVLGNIDEPYPIFHAFTDSDWAGSESRRSISGYVMKIGRSTIAWSSKQQSVVALSSTEAEYMACTHAACEIVWLRQILMELDRRPEEATTLRCDNNAAINYAHDPHNHTRMKHIDIRAHFIRHCVNRKIIDIVRVDGKNNDADVLTKALGHIQHSKALELLNLHRVQGGVLRTEPDAA